MIDDGEPYVVPLNFGYADGVLYFHSAIEGRKIDAIRKNPRVCFTMHTGYEKTMGAKACDCGANYMSLIGYGRAEIVVDPTEKLKGLSALMFHYYGGKVDFDERIVGVTSVIKVIIESLSGKKRVE